MFMAVGNVRCHLGQGGPYFAECTCQIITSGADSAALAGWWEMSHCSGAAGKGTLMYCRAVQETCPIDALEQRGHQSMPARKHKPVYQGCRV